MIDLEHLEKLLAEATPRPWSAGVLDTGEPYIYPPSPPGKEVADCRMVVALRNAAPALIAELKAARELAIAAHMVCLCTHDIRSAGKLAGPLSAYERARGDD